MDLGCIDMGCLDKDSSPKESTMSASEIGKKNKAKHAMRSSSNALNKLTSQISKLPRRKTSPLNWFPRKKVEPYLKRKLKMLQEVDGTHLTLDETLEDSNPHYSRVLREKIAMREAAEKAIEARKAAMVEASWCRILHAARIESKEAEEQLSKAELSAAEAFEAARAVGVIMNDKPDSSQNRGKIETVSARVGSRIHTVSATFETAFAVDKQVAAAVKAAFVKLANCHSINKEEFKELLHRISENPDTDETCSDLSAITSECDSDADSVVEAGSCEDSLKKKRLESDKFNTDSIVDMMLGRLQCLKEEELASLATIVATSGLNAALAETEKSKQQQHPLTDPVHSTENPCPKASKRMSVSGRTARNSFVANHSKGVGDAEIPSLDKFLVKRLSRLEREVLEAKSARKDEANSGSEQTDLSNDSSGRSKTKNKDDGTAVSDLGSALIKHSSKLEKEIKEARMNGKESSEFDNKKSQRGAKQGAVDVDVPLDKYLVKRLTRLEKEVEEARNKEALLVEDKKFKRKEAETDSESDHLLQMEEKEEASSSRIRKLQRKDQESSADYESLDKVLVKHVSRLEKEKSQFIADEKMQRRTKRREVEATEGSLEQVLVKHKSRLEREKMAAAVEPQEQEVTKYSVSRRLAREKELQAAWGGLSLGNSMRPHVSRLQQDKADWLKAEEEEKNASAEEGV